MATTWWSSARHSTSPWLTSAGSTLWTVTRRSFWRSSGNLCASKCKHTLFLSFFHFFPFILFFSLPPFLFFLSLHYHVFLKLNNAALFASTAIFFVCVSFVLLLLPWLASYRIVFQVHTAGAVGRSCKAEHPGHQRRAHRALGKLQGMHDICLNTLLQYAPKYVPSYSFAW